MLEKHTHHDLGERQRYQTGSDYLNIFHLDYHLTHLCFAELVPSNGAQPPCLSSSQCGGIRTLEDAPA